MENTKNTVRYRLDVDDAIVEVWANGPYWRYSFGRLDSPFHSRDTNWYLTKRGAKRAAEKRYENRMDSEIERAVWVKVC